MLYNHPETTCWLVRLNMENADIHQPRLSMNWMNELWHNPKKMPFHVPWNSCCQPGCCRMVVIDDIYQPHLQLSHCSFHLWLVFFSQTHHPPRLIDQYLTLFLPTKTCFLNSLRNYPLVNYLSWLVVEPYPSEKYESQLGWWHSQIWWESQKKSMVPVTTKQFHV